MTFKLGTKLTIDINIIVINLNCRDRPSTPGEALIENANKRQRLEDTIEKMEEDGWRYIDKTKECFVLDALAPNDAFLSFKRGVETLTLGNLFRKFLNDAALDMVINAISYEDTIITIRPLRRVPTPKVHKKVLERSITYRAGSNGAL